MPHFRNVDKGTFLPLREGATSPIWLNFTPKITKIQQLPGGPKQGDALDPVGALRLPPVPMPLGKKHAPLTRIPRSAPVNWSL